MILYVIFGWLLSSQSLLYLHILLIPALVVHWKLNQDRCFLTDLENALAGKEPEPGGFVKSILSQCVTNLPEDYVIERALYGVIIVSWSISVLRLLMAA